MTRKRKARDKMKPFDDNTKLAGAHVPRLQADQLGVAALYHGLRRSDILRELISNYLKTLPPLEDVIMRIAETEYSRWLESPEKPAYKAWRRSVVEELGRKRIDGRHTERILTQMDRLHDSDEQANEKTRNGNKAKAKGPAARGNKAG